MATAKIYCPTKTAMQSGRAKTKRWKLEFLRDASMTPDALMGWNTMSNTSQQLHLWFHTKEEAQAYAASKQLDVVVIEPKKAAFVPKSYAENFSFNRRIAFDKNAQK